MAVAVLGICSSCLLLTVKLDAEWDRFEATQAVNVKRSGVASGKLGRKNQKRFLGRMYAMHGKIKQQHLTTDSNSEAESRENRILNACSSRTDLSLRPRFEESSALCDRHASARSQVELYEMWTRSEDGREEAGCRARERQSGEVSLVRTHPTAESCSLEIRVSARCRERKS